MFEIVREGETERSGAGDEVRSTAGEAERGEAGRGAGEVPVPRRPSGVGGFEFLRACVLRAHSLQ